jgi:predicted transcriptional regulator
MGRRSRTETVVEVVLAFHAQGTWSQAALARHVGLTTPSLRKLLTEMATSGLTLEREEDPPHVYWSVPRG